MFNDAVLLEWQLRSSQWLIWSCLHNTVGDELSQHMVPQQ